MNVRYRQINKKIPKPLQKTSGAAAIDLYSREEAILEPGELGYIPINIAIDIPEGYFGMLVPRSSTHKMGIMSANSAGILDSDFNGNNDEAKFIVINFTDKTVTVKKGVRVAQLLVIKHESIELEEVDDLGNEDRGGIGSTGVA